MIASLGSQQALMWSNPHHRSNRLLRRAVTSHLLAQGANWLPMLVSGTPLVLAGAAPEELCGLDCNNRDTADQGAAKRCTF